MARPRIPFDVLYEKYAVPIPFCGCRIWIGSLNLGGYGRLSEGREKTISAHKKSYEHFVAKVPEGMVVMHDCDMPSCVNPNHLRIGSTLDNVQDKVEKNRQAKGVSHGKSKLTNEQVRRAKFGGENLKNLAVEFGCSKIALNQIRSGRYWKHITQDTGVI
jgi:hypothetical protein